MKKFLTEFKEFAVKGNVVDMAVGVVIGGAFGNIVTSLVNDIITPLIGVITGGQSFDNLKIILNESTELSLNYGSFIQTTIDFIIIAFCIFSVIKLMNSLSRKNAVEEPVVEAAPIDEKAELLKEILAELKKQ